MTAPVFEKCSLGVIVTVAGPACWVSAVSFSLSSHFGCHCCYFVLAGEDKTQRLRLVLLVMLDCTGHSTELLFAVHFLSF